MVLEALIAQLESPDRAAQTATTLQEGLRAQETLSEQIRAAKADELARADQAQADHDRKVAELREALVALERTKQTLTADVGTLRAEKADLIQHNTAIKDSIAQSHAVLSQAEVVLKR